MVQNVSLLWCSWFNRGFMKVGRFSVREGMDHKMIAFWSLAGVSFVCSRLSVNSCSMNERRPKMIKKSCSCSLTCPKYRIEIVFLFREAKFNMGRNLAYCYWKECTWSQAEVFHDSSYIILNRFTVGPNRFSGMVAIMNKFKSLN